MCMNVLVMIVPVVCFQTPFRIILKPVQDPRLFGEDGQFLSFNSLIQVAEESMCSPNTIRIDTQDTDWSEPFNHGQTMFNRYLPIGGYVDFEGRKQRSRTRNRLRADNTLCKKLLSGYNNK